MPKKLALFPMTRDMCAMARYSSLLHDYELTQLLVPGFVKFAGKDISRIDGGSVANIMLAEYNRDALADCGTLFVDYDENMQAMPVYDDVIQEAKQMGKEVILSRNLEKRLQKENFEYLNSGFVADDQRDYLNEIRVPVITVLTQGVRTDQFAVELALRKYYIEEGYKVAQIGSFDASRFFGFTALPNFMHEPRDAYEKTLKLNRFVRDITVKEQPDLLILGIPGATMKYNNRLLNGMGFLPFIACSALRSDLLILSMYYADYKKSYFDEMHNHGIYRLDAPIRFFNLSNTRFDPDASSPDEIKCRYVDLTSDFVLSNIHKQKNVDDYHIFNVLDNNSARSACIATQELLVENVQGVR